MLSVIKVLAVSLLLWMPQHSALAGTFDCVCKNGTVCKISCGCSGAASCGQSDCAGSCGACTVGGHEAVAESVAAGLYRNSFILSRGKFDEQMLVKVFARLLDRDSSKVQVRRVGAPDGAYVTITIREEDVQHTIAVHLPQQFYENQEMRSLMRNHVAKRAPDIVKRKDLDPKYLEQFFTK